MWVVVSLEIESSLWNSARVYMNPCLYCLWTFLIKIGPASLLRPTNAEHTCLGPLGLEAACSHCDTTQKMTHFPTRRLARAISRHGAEFVPNEYRWKYCINSYSWWSHHSNNAIKARLFSTCLTRPFSLVHNHTATQPHSLFIQRTKSFPPQNCFAQTTVELLCSRVATHLSRVVGSWGEDRVPSPWRVSVRCPRSPQK